MKEYMGPESLHGLTSLIKQELNNKQGVLHTDATLQLKDNNLTVTLPTKEITEAEYEKLSEEEKDSTTLFLITDVNYSESGAGSEEAISLNIRALTDDEIDAICV